MLVGRTGLSPTMVGRAAPLARLLGLLTAEPGGREGDGRPAVALVSGEAGIGKSRLLRELIAAAPPGTIVLAGQSEPGSLGRPFELAASLLGGLPPLGDDPVRAVVEAIESRIGQSRALVVAEDLHWADAESVAVVERLAGSPCPALVIVGTYRPDELTRRAPASEVLLRLERRHSVLELRLDRLLRVEIAVFLAAVYGHQPPSQVVDTLANRTGGNPFFLEELLLAAGDAGLDRLCALPLPWSLAELVQRQLDGLTADERRLVEAAAILGRCATFDQLATMTGASEEELIVHLRELVERGLLFEEDEDEFSFRHALVRDAVQGQLLGRERRRLHAMALAALSDGAKADLAQLARHAAGAGEYDRFVALAREGVTHYLSIGSSHQALLLALDALPEAPDDAELLEGGARAAWLVGATEEATALAERWRALARRQGEAADQSAAARLLARLYVEQLRDDELWALVAEIESLNERVSTGVERARNLACIAQVHMLSGRPEEAVRWAELAVAEADLVDAKDVRAQALVERGSALADLHDRLAEGEQALREAIAEAEAVGDWVLVARALNNMVKYLPAGAPENAELVARMRDAAGRAGFDILRAYAPLRAARYAMAVGDQRAARMHLIEASELLPAGHPKSTWLANVGAQLVLESGRPDEAAALITNFPPDDDPDCRSERATLTLALAARRGERLTRATIDELVAEASRYDYRVEALEIALELLEATMALGLDAEALRTTVVAPWEASGATAEDRALVAAYVAVHDGVPEELDALAAGLDRPDLVIAVARRAGLDVALARGLAAHGRRAEALERLRAARERLAAWPGWRRDEVDEAERRLLGATVVDDGATGSVLSPRELEVASLLAEGLSNAELARRLYISPKTAAVHVSNILTKLGMSSRTEVAAWAVRQGLAAGRELSAHRSGQELVIRRW